MIVQVRAPMGAGKSTVVRQLLIEHGGELVEHRAFMNAATGKRVNAQLWRCEADLFVLGRYDLRSTSGKGGDFVNGPVGREIVRHYASLPHLVWESAWGSTEFPKDAWLDDVRRFPITWAMLDTPLGECVRRIEQRRVERGRNVGAPLNEGKLAENHRLAHRQATRAAALGVQVVTLSHEHAYSQLHDLLVFGGWPCDRHTVAWSYAQAA